MNVDDYSKLFNGTKVYLHVSMDDARLLKSLALEKGYTKIIILDMRHHLGCFVFIAEKLEGPLTIYSDLHEDQPTLYKRIRKIMAGLFDILFAPRRIVGYIFLLSSLLFLVNLSEPSLEKTETLFLLLLVFNNVGFFSVLFFIDYRENGKKAN